jgi:Fis family transcriptional regulator, factor for inversion stimulation protein
MNAAKKTKQSKAALEKTANCLCESVKDAMDKYFSDMDGHEPNNLHELVMSEVEKPLIESVIDITRGNISHAAQLLGLNRGTLRSRMQKYGLDK